MDKLAIIDFFFFNDTATTEIYTLSLHDALPIYTAKAAPSSAPEPRRLAPPTRPGATRRSGNGSRPTNASRSEEHTSELQSQSNLVCRLLLEKKKTTTFQRLQQYEYIKEDVVSYI